MKERLHESENETNEMVAELRETKELANAGLSPTKGDQVFSKLKSGSGSAESFQSQQIDETKMDPGESKLEVFTLHEHLENLQSFNRNRSRPPQSSVAQRGNNFDTSMETKVLKEEITILKNKVRSAMKAEENSKRATDGLASGK
ncbi:hypothetical protein Tco_0746861 [Tanacetum coccineum]